jgi:hypothetical protein
MVDRLIELARHDGNGQAGAGNAPAVAAEENVQVAANQGA